jgi:hypothetical protein
MLKHGKVAFSPRSLNLHRRHASGVTISGLDERQFEEIRRVQQRIRAEFDVPAGVITSAECYLASLDEQLH